MHAPIVGPTPANAQIELLISNSVSAQTAAMRPTMMAISCGSSRGVEVVGVSVMIARMCMNFSNDDLTEEETARRRDEALLRALSTPPKLHSAMKIGKRKAKASDNANPRKSARDRLRRSDEPIFAFVKRDGFLGVGFFKGGDRVCACRRLLSSNHSHLALSVPYSSPTHVIVIIGPPDFSWTTSPAFNAISELDIFASSRGSNEAN